MKRLGLLFLCFIQLSCTGQKREKINGVSFVGSREKVAQTHVEPVVKVNANFAAVMPFGFARSLDSPQIVFNTERQWYGETRRGVKQYIDQLRKNGIKIMLKPQIWIWRGEFTGDMAMQSEEDWQTLEETYSDFALTYAQLAEETKAEVFCMGTELEEFVKQRPLFWTDLIAKIRKIYSGKLTYAANWDEYPRVPFWDQMDYIGVDAYFPLSEAQKPSLEMLKAGWQPWKIKLANLAETTDRPILFTEFGYRSMDYAAKKPWLVDRNQMNVNLQAQANAMEAVFQEFWEEDWFAGGFVWKWFINHHKVGGKEDNRFTPQNKPAEQVLRRYFQNHQESRF